MQQNKFSGALRVIWAIVLKDIVDALKNKMTLSVVMGVMVMMASNTMLPLMLTPKDTPIAIAYTPEKSTLVRGLTTRDEFKLRLADSQQEMQDAVGKSAVVVLGLGLPPEFNQAAGSGEVVQVEGYAPHWADPQQVAELVVFFEQELGKASWQTVRINVEGHTYPPIDAGGQPLMVVMNLSMVLFSIGMSMVPYLLLDEKEMRTFDALLVSPARFSQIVIAKALVGLFYCLCAVAVALLFSFKFFVHWDVVILAIALGAALAVAIGLLTGAMCETQAAVNLWMGLALIGLLVPMFLTNVTSSRLPPIVQTILPWIPSVAFRNLIGYSMAGDLGAASVWLNAAILAGAAFIVLLVVVWRVRQSDR
ncbi:MAG: ABC transporter permease [Chloroflexi bacterium]|nr:ABC transporter permease [Chloroflexota bacterium]